MTWSSTHRHLPLSQHHMAELVYTVLNPSANVLFVTLTVAVRGQQYKSDALFYISIDPVRCHRTNRECRPSVTVRRRNPKKPVALKSSRLEEKIDGLVSMLKGGAQSDAINANTHGIAAVSISAQRSSVGTNHPTSVTSALDEGLPNLRVLTPETTTSEGSISSPPTTALHDTLQPSPTEAEQYLSTFKTYKARYFPFIHVPSTTTPQQLRQERPFLWLCIMTIAARSKSQQQVLGSKVRDTLAQEMLFKSEQRIDLLLGLLACIGWYDICQSQN